MGRPLRKRLAISTELEIARLINEEGLTQRQVADELGYTPSALQQLIVKHAIPVPVRSDAPRTGIQAWKKYTEEVGR